MRRLLGILVLIGLGLLGTHRAQAATCTATDCTFTASWAEPTTLATTPPSPLTDLQSTTLSWQVTAPTTGAVQTLVVPATTPTGGGTITKTIVLPIAPGQVVTFKGWVNAERAAAGAPDSAQSAITTVVKDRTGEVPASAPSNLTIQ